jgi:phytoene dehydrogenase-like protein
MERAYDDAKYGRYSRRPYIDIVIPSLTDPSVAPPGKHVMSCFVQYAPYHLKEGTWDDQREAFGDTVVNTIAEYAPNIRDLILHRQVLTPLDLEREWGLRAYQDDPDSTSWSGQNVYDVYSKSGGTGLDGTKYREWD